MTFAVDSNVLLDVFTNDPTFADASIAALTAAAAQGCLVACEVVFSETSSAFADPEAFREQMAAMGIAFAPMTEEAALRAGAIWRLYRARQKRHPMTARRGVIPDFMVGAHALACADALITRDRGFLRDYFKDLKVIDPSRS